ncbi:MAG: hypothetical protein ACK4JX_10715 [Flavobacterium sp.]
MKNTLKFLFILLSLHTSHSQGIYLNQKLDPISTGALFLEDNNKYKKVEGTPYISEKFMLGNIGNSTQNLLFRYNAESDEIEIKFKGDSIFVLPKNSKMSTISFDNKKYVLSKYKSAKDDYIDGYLIELYKGKIELYKREKIQIKEARPATNNYEIDRPAKFEKIKDEFYWSASGNLEIMPNNKKKVIEFFPLHKEKLNDFFKNNNISFSNEKDLTNLIKFIESIL